MLKSHLNMHSFQTSYLYFKIISKSKFSIFWPKNVQFFKSRTRSWAGAAQAYLNNHINHRHHYIHLFQEKMSKAWKISNLFITFWKKTLQAPKTSQLPARAKRSDSVLFLSTARWVLYESLETGGKPSTWFPPE